MLSFKMFKKSEKKLSKLDKEWKKFEPLLLPRFFDTGYDPEAQHKKIEGSGKENMNISFIKKVYRVFKYIKALNPKITSGYREAGYNKTIGGAKNSQHVQGIACDIQLENRFSKSECEKLYDFIDKTYPICGLGFYQDIEQDGRKSYFIHFDDRNYKARWARISNKYVDINEVVNNG